MAFPDDAHNFPLPIYFGQMEQINTPFCGQFARGCFVFDFVDFNFFWGVFGNFDRHPYSMSRPDRTTVYSSWSVFIFT